MRGVLETAWGKMGAETNDHAVCRFFLPECIPDDFIPDDLPDKLLRDTAREVDE